MCLQMKIIRKRHKPKTTDMKRRPKFVALSGITQGKEWSVPIIHEMKQATDPFKGPTATPSLVYKKTLIPLSKIPNSPFPFQLFP
jgi:hypothetical protein